MKNKLLLLAILDGWGISFKKDGNAIKLARTPIFDALNKNYPPVKLIASGRSVGLPDGQIGNSEVGHMNIGAGRVVFQDLPKINVAIEDGSFFKNQTLINAINHARKNGSSLHLAGLLSDGGVHSHIEHLFALLDMAKDFGQRKVYIHAFLDGRDVSPNSSVHYIKRLADKLACIGVGKISTISGRYYTMDRDNRWERIEKGYNAMVNGKGDIISCPVEVIENSYKKGVTDEFVNPSVISPGDKDSFIKSNDSVIFFNFRSDRMRELVKTFITDDFRSFKIENKVKPFITSFTEYEADFNIPVAFSNEMPKMGLGEVISKNMIPQLRIAETEKYPHVTFFFNGGLETPFPLEDRILVPSPKVATYDLKPDMSAHEVTEKLIDAIISDNYGFILLNYANPDMVGHTGIIDAAIKAVETIDECIGKVMTAMKKVKGDMIITSDHGNIEYMLDDSNLPATYHTTNPVPFYCITDNKALKLRENGILADVAPTVIKLLGIEAPREMTGKSLID